MALEASGIFGHVLFLTLVEAGFEVVMTAPAYTRQIKGRPKTDRRDCQWIQRLHALGFLPSVFQPDDATQTFRSYVCHPDAVVIEACANAGWGHDQAVADGHIVKVTAFFTTVVRYARNSGTERKFARLNSGRRRRANVSWARSEAST